MTRYVAPMKAFLILAFCFYSISMIMIAQRVWIDHDYEYLESNETTITTTTHKNIVGDIPLLTLFTSWKSKMENKTVYNNTMHLWPSLHPDVQVVLFSDENETNSYAQNLGWKLLPITMTKCNGTPVLKQMFADVKKEYKSVFYGYSNGDILYDESIVDTLKAVAKWMNKLNKPVLLSGKRISFEIDKRSTKSSVHSIVRRGVQYGALDYGYAEDYFLVSSNFQWKFFPDLVIGRPKVDNHLIFMSRKKGVVVIDASSSIVAIHQKTKSRKKGMVDCNKEILQKAKQYDMRRIRRGNLECANFETRYNREGEVQVFRRGQFTTTC